MTSGGMMETGMTETRMRTITLRTRVVIQLLAIVLLALSAGRALATESEQQQQRELFKQGAKLWPVYCAQCHNARPGSEFSPEQWDVIMMHMRTQANLPAQDARALTEYLKRSH
jgi:cytochrome c2